MLKLIDKLLDINYFVFDEKVLVYKTTNKSIFINKESIDENVNDDLILFSNYLFYNKNNDCNVFNIKTKETNKINNQQILNSFPRNEKKGILIDHNENLHLLDKNNLSKQLLDIKNYNWGILYLDSDLYIQDDTIILSYGLNNNSHWKFSLNSTYDWLNKSIYEKNPDLEKKGEIDKILGVYNHSLWLVLNSGWVLEIDVNNGTSKKYIQEGKMIKGKSDINGFKGNFKNDSFIDKENGLIINLIRDFYVEYDLKTNKEYFESYNFVENCNEHKLNLNYIAGYDAKNIYAFEGSDNNRFAVFSREKKEIVWSDEILDAKGKFPAIREMKFEHKKLCILDYNNILNIYE